ncbi:MAG TPA: response regulator transcription factor [Gemmatimonadaceae bacterium]
MTTDVIRVLLADDHRVVRAGLRAVLGTTRDITVVGEASNGREAVSLAALVKPDVVVMDLAMPELDGVAATKAIIAADPGVRVLVLSMHAEQEYLVPVMEAGAAGYLLKTEADRELVNAVRAVAHGDVFVRPAAARILARRLVGRDEESSDKDRYARLTERERDVLRLVGQGYSAPEIGDRLLISPKTVDTYKQRIHEKLGLAHRSQYVQFAFRLGLLVTE